MPYDVTGWVEANRFAPEERDPAHSFWMPLLSLDTFLLGGDAVSAYLFGLSKSADGSGCFVDRGVPEDCSPVVRRDIEANLEFIRRHGEGDFGHTFATMEEIRDALRKADPPRLDESEWAHALAAAEFSSRAPGVTTVTYLRVIVWANW
jgi:hypothetical protein